MEYQVAYLLQTLEEFEVVADSYLPKHIQYHPESESENYEENQPLFLL